MSLVNFSLPVTRYLVKAGVLEKDPFALLDVGCSGGIFDIWRVFDKYLISHGFDPQQSEVDRLNENESCEGIHYHAFHIGLPDTHEFCIERSKTDTPEYFEPWQRLSAAASTVLQDRHTKIYGDEYGNGYIDIHIAKVMELPVYMQEEEIC